MGSVTTADRAKIRSAGRTTTTPLGSRFLFRRHSCRCHHLPHAPLGNPSGVPRNAPRPDGKRGDAFRVAALFGVNPDSSVPADSEIPPDDTGAAPAGNSQPGDQSGEQPDTTGNEPEPQSGVTRSQLTSATRARGSRRRKRIVLITFGSLLGVVVLIFAAGVAFLLYENSRIHRVDVKHLAKVQTQGAQKDVENILLIGSTTRCGLKQQNAAFGLCDQGVTGVNSDVVMILHLDPDHHRASILSIPRDTFVPNAHPDGVNKIDAALGAPGGPSQLIAAITEDFGIPIQHYVELNFDGFQGVVDALGGLKMYFPMPVYDQESSLYVPNTGCQPLNGFQALAVVRARHLQYRPTSDAGVARYDWPYDPQSDLSRIRRDHEFLRVMASAVARRGTREPRDGPEADRFPFGKP